MNKTIQTAYYPSKDKFWKSALVALLNTENSITIPNEVVDVEDLDPNQTDISYSSIYLYLHKTEYVKDIRTYIESLDDYHSSPKEDVYSLFENIMIQQSVYLIKKFEVSKYLEKVSSPIEDSVMSDKYLLTSKGIDVALKLQEHADNERRFKENYLISKTLQTNSKRSLIISSIALILTIVALTLAFVRLDRTDKILEQSERRLTIAEKNHADTLRKK